MESSWLPHARQCHQKISPPVKVCSLQSALHESSTFCTSAPKQGAGSSSGRVLLLLVRDIQPVKMFFTLALHAGCGPPTQTFHPCPLLLRQQGGEDKSCLSMFARRETLQKLASVCWRSGASREWSRVGFFRIRVCSCFMNVCMHNNVFNVTTLILTDPYPKFCWLT